MGNTVFFLFFFQQVREVELQDFVTQEAQSVSAHWCSELTGFSLRSPINSAARHCCRTPHPAPTQSTHTVDLYPCRDSLFQSDLDQISALLQPYLFQHLKHNCEQVLYIFSPQVTPYKGKVKHLSIDHFTNGIIGLGI